MAESLVKRFPNESKPTPSEEWIHLQFWPRNPYASSAIQYTSHFQVKYAVQAHQMRKSHPDARYVVVILQYVKQFLIAFKQYTLLLSVDDQAIVSVGEPGNPISSDVQGDHHTLVPMGGPTVTALDHDFQLHGIVLSLALAIEITDSHTDSFFFTGQLYVSNKDKVNQPSSPHRHSAAIVQLVRTNSVSYTHLTLPTIYSV